MSAPASPRGFAGLGALLVGVAVFFLAFAATIARTGPGAANTDPGPRFFPVMLAIVVGAAGVVELLRWLRSSGDRETPLPRPLDRQAPEEAGQRIQPTWLILALSAYLPAIQIVGLFWASSVFVTAVMLRLGSRWPFALGSAAFMTVFVQLLFESLFSVSLPRGYFDLPTPTSWLH